MESLATVLRRIPLFAELPRGGFAKIIADLREERVERGALVCAEGMPADDFYIVKSGVLDVLVKHREGSSELVATLRPDDWFGESALFSDKPRTATVVARTDAELWRLPRDKFRTLIEENPWLTFHFMEVMSDRLLTENRELSRLRSAVGQWVEATSDAAADPAVREAHGRLAEAMTEHDAAARAPTRPGRESGADAAASAFAPARVLAGLAAVALAAGILLFPLPAGLSSDGQRMLALLACAAILWAFDVLPDFAVGLGLIVGWIILGVVPPEVAVSGFTSGPFFLIIGVLGMAASLQASGLLFRIALYILRAFPLTHRGQTLALATSGTAITAFVPDVTSGVAIAAPITLALSDTLGYARRSRGSAGLAMAAVLGFGQMSPFFLTGAAENLLGRGLLPPEQQDAVTWFAWLIAGLPLAVVTFGCGWLATLVLLPPEIEPTSSSELIGVQIEALGPMSRAEILNALVLGGAIVGWITAPYHGIDVAWIALLGLTIVTASNLLERTAFRAGIFWDFLFYLGAVLSLTDVVRHLGIDRWMIDLLDPVLQPLIGHPGLFLLGLTVFIYAARFVLPSFPLVSLLTITTVPIARGAGIEPIVLLLVLSTAVSVWFLPYQSAYYLALYFGTKEQAFSHRQVRPIAWLYGAIYLLAVLVAIPFWQWLGLLPP